MEWLWLALITIVLLFCLLVFYRMAFIKGYKAGGRRVLLEWKKSLNEIEEDYNG
jgi:hypothetical protein